MLKKYWLDKAKKSVKENLNGYFTYGNYKKKTKPDIKFGHNKIDFVCQVPVLGIIVYLFVACLIEIVVFPFVVKQKLCYKFKKEKQ